MKIALITDVHWGVRNDNSTFVEYFKNFYENVFFPTLDRENITDVIMLGDTFDKRKYSNHTTIKLAKEIYFNELLARNIKTHMLIGNHDTTYKNTLETNSVTLLLSEYKNIKIINQPTTVAFNDLDITLIPWICSDNREECMNFIQSTRSEVCMGHFEISGFEMYRGQPCFDGLSVDTFNKFDMVFTGHYHHKSTSGNITYLGTPYEMTWHDHNDPKGFHIFDTDTRKLTFVQNPYKMFIRLEYNDLNQEPINLDEFNLENTYIKLVVVNKNDYYKFDKFINKLYTKGCHEIKIIEDMSDFNETQLDEKINLEDTLSILLAYIDTINNIDKKKVNDFMKSLYTEALSVEDI
jgi:hypothetical protein